ncbi:asparaginase [Intrasporangium sp. DVR]|uniref:asparaginase n=1 Tax=Intrasporangium sp. DVR TaxID=3127867 RepID=UPI00333FF3A3
MTSSPVVAHVVRGGFVESVHHGLAVVTAPDGSVDLEVGDSSGPIFPRSSSKPIQALAMVRHGLDTTGALLSLACSSHSGEDFHIEAARAILERAGLSEADLQNTPDHPYDEVARTAWIAAGRPKQSIVQNCSGKHASMLATCVLNGWDIGTYRDPRHPLQVAIAETVSELAGADPVAVAVDGCGAPIHAIPLAGLARSFGRLAAATDGPEARVAGAIRDFPEYLGGTRRDVTTLIRQVPGLIAKDGAEAVYAVGLPDGRGIAVKIADGSSRARSVVLAAVLRRIGVTDDVALAALEHQPVLGHGQPVGAVVAVDI